MHPVWFRLFVLTITVFHAFLLKFVLECVPYFFYIMLAYFSVRVRGKQYGTTTCIVICSGIYLHCSTSLCFSSYFYDATPVHIRYLKVSTGQLKNIVYFMLLDSPLPPFYFLSQSTMTHSRQRAESRP